MVGTIVSVMLKWSVPVQVSRSFAVTFLLNGLNYCKKRKDGGFRLKSTEDTGRSHTLFQLPVISKRYGMRRMCRYDSTLNVLRGSE